MGAQSDVLLVYSRIGWAKQCGHGSEPLAMLWQQQELGAVSFSLDAVCHWAL